MKLEKFAKKWELTSDELIYALKQLGYFKNNGEPKNTYINKGWFSDSGDVMKPNEVFKVLDEKIEEVNRLLDMKQIEELTQLIENQNELIQKLSDKIDELSDKIDNDVDEPVKKERKPRKPIDWSTKCRGLIGKTINGWEILGEKLNVIARKPGKEDIIMSGMRKKEDLLDLLTD